MYTVVTIEYTKESSRVSSKTSHEIQTLLSQNKDIIKT